MPTLTAYLKALGLNTQPNALEAPVGSMTDASNVVIRRGDVIEPARGFALYGNSFGSSSDRATQLSQYRNRLLRYYGDTLQYDDGNGIFTSFAGSYFPVEPGLRIKSVVASGNYYFTTSTGIQKLSATTATEFTPATGYITPAGAQAALGFTATLDVTQGSSSGFLPQDSAVAYEVLWGYKDVNGNLVLGAPSSLVQVYNPLQQLIILDLNTLASALDSINYGGSLINDGTYSALNSLPITASATALQANIASLAVQLDQNIQYANTTSGDPLVISTATQSGSTVTINFSSGNPSNYLSIGSNIFLTGTGGGGAGSGFQPTQGILNGPQVVTFVNSTSLQLQATSSNLNTTAIGITSISASNPATITTSSAHGLTTGDSVTITGSNSTPSIDGVWQVTVLSTTTFTIPANVTTAGTSGSIQSYAVSQPIVVESDAIIYSYDFENIVNTNSVTLSIPATDAELVVLQTQVLDIMEKLKLEPVSIIPSANATLFIDPLSITTTANVDLSIVIPAGTGPQYFYQVYRSQIVSATGVTSITQISPSAELQLVYEAFPTAAQLAADVVNITDITPQAFLGAFLYTNQASGLGATAANAVPPIAKDINVFKNVTFYANIVGKQNMFGNLLGVQNILNEGGNPSITISNGVTTSTYYFVAGVNQISQIITVADVSNSLNGKWFSLWSAENATEYVFYYKTSGGADTPPSVPGASIIQILIQTNATNATVASLTSNTIGLLGLDFFSIYTGNTITITNTNPGPSTHVADGSAPTGFAFSTPTPGAGQNTGTNSVLLSTNPSVGIAVNETAISLVNVINQDPNSSVYAFYTSSVNGVPGQIYFESRTFGSPVFYMLASDATVGASFNPNISPLTNITITGISVANPTVITTSAAHGLINGEEIMISGSNSTPNINGIWPVTVIDSTHFTIPVNVTNSGNGLASYQLLSSVLLQSSTNSALQNRIYYSQYLQPDAVPIVNFLDVGSTDKAILRIFPLRDSLFVFKEDGLYRISGEIAPWNLSLFDTSCILIAPDSVDITNNQIFIYTNQGIYAVTESGSQDRSEAIKETLLQAAIDTNFSTATWGVGYNSDNSFLMFTTSNINDTEATICYRYSTLTNTWTTLDRSNTCGVNFTFDDKLYLGAGDTDYIEQERKNLDRTDYANRQYVENIVDTAVNGNVITLTDSAKLYSIGDVVYQDQLLSIYQFNALLNKLDLDHAAGGIPQYTVGGVVGWYNNLNLSVGADLRTGIVNLAAALDSVLTNTPTYSASVADYTISLISNTAANSTIITTSVPNNLTTGRYVTIGGVVGSIPSINGNYAITVIDSTHFSIPVNVTTIGTNFTGATVETLVNTFQDQLASFNTIIGMLNVDVGTKFRNYMPITNDTPQEAIITNVNYVTNQLTLNLTLPFVVGPITIYKAIPTSVTYTPNIMQDPIALKHLSEATLMVLDNTFTNGKLSFSTDLLPEFIDVPFNGEGVGLFGLNDFGTNYFGGLGNSAPIRTYIPRQCQRCRYINVQFSHNIAREKMSVYGITVTGNNTGSSRAYR